jgi:hypothetical protein
VIQGWLLGNKERDLIAPQHQAPQSAPKKDTPSRADWHDSSVFFGQCKFAVLMLAQ